jgi:hypothetical protein
VDLEKRVALLSVVIGVCVGCTCDSGWCGRPVRGFEIYFTVEMQFEDCLCLVLDLCNGAKYLSFRAVEVSSSLVLKFISHQDTVTGNFAQIK